MTERKKRLAKNEALFRQVNERIREVGETFAVGEPSPIDFVCECVDEACHEPIRLSLERYERIRAEPTHFVVLKGHETLELERVVRAENGFVVVEKLADEAEIARETDPRG